MNLKNKFKKFFTLRKGAEDGFTLVELVVVIAILGILAAVSIPAYDQYIEYVENNNDQQLVAAANRAFAAACIEAKYDSIDMASASVAVKNLKITGLSGVTHATKEITNDEKVNIATNFMLYMLGNENLQFKNEGVKSLIWNVDHFEISLTNVAIPDVVLSNGEYASLDQAALNNIADSYIGELNEEELAVMMDVVKNNAKDGLIDSVEEEMAKKFPTNTDNWATNFTNKAIVKILNALPKEQAGAYLALESGGIASSGIFSEEQRKAIQGDLFSGSEEDREAAMDKFTNGMLLYTANVLQNKKADEIYSSVKDNYFDESKNIVETGGMGGKAVSAAIRESVFQGYLSSESGAQAYADALTANNGDETKAAESLRNSEGFKGYIDTDECKNDIAGLISTMQVVDKNAEIIGNDAIVEEGMSNEDVQKIFAGITGY